MPNRDDIKFAWWKIACEKNPDAIAFVGLDNRFLFCNNAWSKLLGYSESELKTKTWQDITKIEDIGSDQSEINNIISQKKEDYYLEKTYIRKGKTSVTVKIYVHRYPEDGNGDHEGYIVFAKRLTNEDYEDLKSKFLDLQNTVFILQQNAVTSDIIASKMEIIEQKLEQNKEIAKLAIDRNNINIGDKFGDSSNKAGRDNVSGLSGNTIFFIALLIIVALVLFSLLGGLIIYLILNTPPKLI